MEKRDVCVYACICVYVCVCTFLQTDTSHKLQCDNYFLPIENNYFTEISFALLTLEKS